MPHAAGNKDRFSRVLDALNWGIPEIQHALRMTITRDGISIEWSMHQLEILNAGDDTFER